MSRLADVSGIRISGLKTGRHSPVQHLLFGARGGLRPACRRWLRVRRLDTFQPCFLPENQAKGLAAAIRLPVAAHSFQVYRVGHRSSGGPVDCIAGFVGALINAKPLAAVLKHLWHEGQLLEAPIAIERRQNFFFGTHFDPFSSF